METKKIYKFISLILLPFIIGYLINILVSMGITKDNQSLLSISNILLSIWTNGGSIILWFWTGRIFSNSNMTKVKSFVLGNFAWATSLILFIWQFVIVDGSNRNFFISGISQHYPLGFVSLGSGILGLFTNSIHSTTVILIAYVLMLLVFTLGFISIHRYKRKEMSNKGSFNNK